MSRTQKTRAIVLTALFCAMIFLATYSLKMSFPGINGYIHLGDAFILLSAAFLPTPFAAVAAGFGSAVADVASGYAIYAPFTLVIKLCMTFFITSRRDRIITVRNVSGSVGAGLIMVLGYYLTEVFLYKNFFSPFAAIPMNLMQAASGVLIFAALGVLFDRMHLKNIIRT